MSPFRLARLSLSRHLFSTGITVIAIALSVACGGLLLRLSKISDSRFSAMGNNGDAIVGAKAGGIEILLSSLNGEGNFPDFLPYKLFESLQSQQSVRFEDGATSKPNFIQAVIPIVYFAKLEGFKVIGTNETFYFKAHSEQKLALSEGRWATAPGEIVLGSAIARLEHKKLDDLVVLEAWVGDKISRAPFRLKVVGVLDPTQTIWDRSAFSTVEQAHQVLSQNPAELAQRSIWGASVLHYFFIYLNPGGFSQLEALINKRTVGQVVKVDEEKEKLKELTGVGKKLGIFVTVFVILLGGLAVCGMLVTRFEGMSVQLAVLRALGFTKKHLAKWLLWEGFLLAAIGVFCGALLDALCLPFLRELLGSALPSPQMVSSSIGDSGLIWSVAIMATVISVTVPMLRMSRQDTHSSLR